MPARKSYRWVAWVERMARTAPRPVAIFFRAELGFLGFRAEAKRRHAVVASEMEVDGGADDPRSRSRRAPDRRLLAQRLVPLCMLMAIVGMAAGARVQLVNAATLADAASGGTPGVVDGDVVAPFGVGGGPGQAAVGTRDLADAAPPATAGSPGGAAAAPPVVVERTIPARRGALPVGKGMWIWMSEMAEGGDAGAIVARAKDVGLTHLYVRTGTLNEGFYNGAFLDRLLPAAHAANLRVYAWDFPYLDDVGRDVNRAVAAITHLTPDGHRVDGYVADIELRSMGVNLTPATASLFGASLREAVGPAYPLIVTVPRPSPLLVTYPYAEVVASFDAIAPMVYWLHRDPVEDVTGALRDLAVFGKPVLPVGQAYDAGAEGGPPGVPPRPQLIRFMQTGENLGAVGVSWWSWQHADQEAWDAVRDAAEFRLPVGDPATFNPGQIRAYQTLLTSLGFPVGADGAWGPPTDAAVRAYQEAARLPVTGIIDAATQQVLLTPFAPPLKG